MVLMALPYRVQQAIVFCVLYISYACFHCARKTLSGVKPSLIVAWTDEGASNSTSRDGALTIQTSTDALFNSREGAEDFLGELDTLMMGAYALTTYFSGRLGDTFNPKYVIAAGSILSGIFLFLFGSLSGYTDFYSVPYYCVMYILFGIAQTAGAPNCPHIITNWFSRKRRGLAIGIWATCQQFGNIFGSAIAAATLSYGYEVTFLINSILLIVGGILVLVLVDSKPPPIVEAELPHSNGAGYLSTAKRIEHPKPVEHQASVEHERVPPIGLFRAVLLPGVIPYALCFGCIKLVNYAFFFWLPYYLFDNFHWHEAKADEVSVWYDIGGIGGSVIAGCWSDFIGFRSPVAVTFLAGSAVSILVYSATPGDVVLNGAVMFFVGGLINGPANLVGMTVAADIGSRRELIGNAEAVSSVTGILDTVGSATAAAGQIVVPYLQEAFDNWSLIFYLLVVLDLIAIVCLLRLFYSDLLLWRPWKVCTERARRTDRRSGEHTPLL